MGYCCKSIHSLIWNHWSAYSPHNLTINLTQKVNRLNKIVVHCHSVASCFKYFPVTLFSCRCLRMTCWRRKSRLACCSEPNRSVKTSLRPNATFTVSQTDSGNFLFLILCICFHKTCSALNDDSSWSISFCRCSLWLMHSTHFLFAHCM